MTNVSASSPLSAIVADARALHDQGDLAGARVMLEDAWEIASAAYGGEHPQVIETARLLAGYHHEAGDLSGARRVLETTQAAGQLRLTDDDPLMLLLAYDLGVVAHEFGNRHEARRNLGLVSRLGPAVLGAAHPAVRAATSYIDTGEGLDPGRPGEVPPPVSAPALTELTVQLPTVQPYEPLPAPPAPVRRPRTGPRHAAEPDPEPEPQPSEAHPAEPAAAQTTAAPHSSRDTTPPTSEASAQPVPAAAQPGQASAQPEEESGRGSPPEPPAATPDPTPMPGAVSQPPGATPALPPPRTGSRIFRRRSAGRVSTPAEAGQPPPSEQPSDQADASMPGAETDVLSPDAPRPAAGPAPAAHPEPAAPPTPADLPARTAAKDPEPPTSPPSNARPQPEVGYPRAPEPPPGTRSAQPTDKPALGPALLAPKPPPTAKARPDAPVPPATRTEPTARTRPDAPAPPAAKAEPTAKVRPDAPTPSAALVKPAPSTSRGPRQPPRPAAYPRHKAPRRRRTPAIVAAVLAALAILAAAATVVVRFMAAAPPAASSSPTASPTAQVGPVTGVRLSDGGESITLSWLSPPDSVPVVVSGAPAGEQSRVFAALPPGSTSYTAHGLDPELDYCFTVVAVYSTEVFAPSQLACTQRSASPSPSNPQESPTP